MKAIEIYMNINGRGAEAITFYEEAFNTKAEHVTTFAQGWPDCSPELEHLQAVPWSPAYGNVTDKYGMTWQINTELS